MAVQRTGIYITAKAVNLAGLEVQFGCKQPVVGLIPVAVRIIYTVGARSCPFLAVAVGIEHCESILGEDAR